VEQQEQHQMEALMAEEQVLQQLVEVVVEVVERLFM
jgi:hypothetical protein